MSRVFCDPACVRYHTPGHPESPERVEGARAWLERSGWRLLPPDCQAAAKDVSLAHDAGHLGRVRDGDYCDPDTPHYDGIDAFALASASAAVSAARSALAGEPAFSLMRPPGHHAGKDRVAGFCYLNNVAIASASLSALSPGIRLAILDIDVHHGDGTQDIVLGLPGVRFASLHQVPLYPGTGLRSVDNCLNFPLPPGTGEAVYLRTLESALASLLDFGAEVLAVSAGFDTYKGDPIARLKLEKTTYGRIGRLISQTGLKRFAVLEGGYAADLPVLIENFLGPFF